MRSFITVCIFAIILTISMCGFSEAAYRKPPFNGSIFGKRNSLEYDNAKAITAMCEIALEACQSWFPQGESK
ncbi:neuropeptide SIFamide [Rhagoletis pomonella]|uniref:neuropeptide SIFamide n=1 Tax=Rhagoletis pomonella TaxID=28610 RepID=UPI001783364B|nr:neuropeptide SIFamide [Rhagoletis pomonella]XP_036331481.1 neuropeptide SIFamide [Rhagoletis pomonella]XP_036331482.1 neuropeptide SIFamide [Rhagoletis pomonella]